MNPMQRTQHFGPRGHQRGVTLIELMIVVIVVAILGIIAIPSYRAYTVRAHRTEAKSALLRLAANEERFYLQNNAYTLNPVNLGFVGSLSENGVYTLAIVSPNGVTQDFRATATPTPGGGTNGVNMGDDAECASYTIDSAGVRAATPDPNGSCW
jgi:type IV pilus assembly protein PilE